MEQQRFLVRRATAEVFVWTELLAKHHRDLEEVWAASAKEATDKEAMPDPRKMSLDTLDAMTKADLLMFAQVKLGKKLDVTLSKEDLRDAIKQLIFTAPIDDGARADQPSGA
jgi:hypothetical protein